VENGRAAAHAGIDALLLQFGHGSDAVENLGGKKDGETWVGLLQFGHGSDAVEN